MKKNVMMRVASIMLVLVLMSSSVISGTFAKYVTEGSATDTARVAKFGVQVSANFDSLFTQGYEEAKLTSTDDYNKASVWADTVVGVVAPGTTGELADFVITGQPEVDVLVSYEATVELTGQWYDETADFYCPLNIVINHADLGTPIVLSGLDYADADAFEQAIFDNVKTLTKKYEAGQNLNDAKDDLEITWTWAFEGDPAAGLVNKQTDVSDTFLGNWILNYPTEAPFISVTVECTVTQVD